jgi:hypothetical protein
MKSGQNNKYDITKASGLECAGLVFIAFPVII